MGGLLRWLLEPDRPGLGVELRQGEIVLVRFLERRGGPEMDLCLKAPLPTGVVEFSMVEPNIREPDTLARFLRHLLDQAGARTERVALTLPDTLAKVSLLELSEASVSRGELAELARFRLKKSLPFEASRARLALQPLPGTSATYLTGIMHDDVVSQYEDFLGSMGFHAGVIETSSLSLLNLWGPLVVKDLRPESDYFFLNLEESYFTVSLVRDRDTPVLVRTLGQRLPAADGEGGGRYPMEELVGEIVPTLIFYREKLRGGSLARVYYRSLRSDLEPLQEMLEEQFEVPAERFDLHRAVAIGKDLAVEEPLASVAGAAAGAAYGKAA